MTGLQVQSTRLCQPCQRQGSDLATSNENSRANQLICLSKRRAWLVSGKTGSETAAAAGGGGGERCPAVRRYLCGVQLHSSQAVSAPGSTPPGSAGQWQGRGRGRGAEKGRHLHIQHQYNFVLDLVCSLTVETWNCFIVLNLPYIWYLFPSLEHFFDFKRFSTVVMYSGLCCQ